MKQCILLLSCGSLTSSLPAVTLDTQPVRDRGYWIQQGGIERLESEIALLIRLNVPGKIAHVGGLFARFCLPVTSTAVALTDLPGGEMT